MALGAGAAGVLYRTPAPRALMLCLLAAVASAIALLVLHRLFLLLQDPLHDELRRAIVFWRKIECLMLMAIGIALVQFIRAVRANLGVLGVSDAAWPTATAAILWLLPVVNVVFGAVLLREAWQASDPERAQSLFVNWRQSAGGSLPLVWAVLCLFGLGLVLVPWLSLGFEPGAGGLQGALLSIAGCVVLTAAHLVLIVMVIMLARRQDRRAARRDVGALPAW